jgi:ribonuclease D
MILTIFFYKNDLPSTVKFEKSVAIDTEAMGLLPHRDRLCLVQLADSEGNVYLVQMERDNKCSPHLKKLLEDESIQKIFHYARFDVALLMYTFKININNIYCTKIASKLCRTYTSHHGLKNLCKDLLNVELSKVEQTSDWGSENLTDEQKGYAAKDVLYLHALKQILDDLLKRENRLDLAHQCFDFLPVRARLDLLSGEQFDIFSHQ